MIKKPQLVSVQAARGVAAFLVMVAHFAHMLMLPKYSGNNSWGFDFLTTFGRAGVDFFFVVSGFIIYLIHVRDIGRSNRIYNFAVKRICRVYPLYWVVFFGYVFLYFLGFGESISGGDFAYFLRSFFLVPLDGPSFVVVSWTLSHEFLFYIVFAFLIWNKKIGLIILWAWFAAILIGCMLEVKNFPLSFLLDLRNIGFFVGLFLGYLLDKNIIIFSKSVFLLGVLVFFGTSAARLYFGNDGYTPFYAVGAFLMLWPLIGLERNGMVVSGGKMMKSIGDSSYALYLTHPLIGSLSIKIIFGLGLNYYLPDIVILFVCSGAALLAGVFVHRHIENALASALTRAGFVNIFAGKA